MSISREPEKTVLVLQNTIMAYRKPVYNGLAERYEVTVLHSGQPSVGPEDLYSEIIVEQSRIGPFHMNNGPSLSKALKQCDVVIAMFDLRWPAYLFPLFFKARPKYILWGHRYSANRMANRARDYLMKRADRLLMYGDEETERMIRRGVDPDKIIMAWNTIHIPNHKDCSNRSKSSLLFVGRLQARKRVDQLIDAFDRLQGSIGDEIMLDIVGSGEEKTALKQLAEERGLSNKVIFHGRIDDPDVLLKIFQKAYAYISPGPIGLGSLHALAYGVPVLTSKAVRYGPEFFNLRHGHNALLFETQHEMVGAIKKICTHTEYTTKLGRNAYHHYADKRSLEHMLAGIRQAIEQ